MTQSISGTCDLVMKSQNEYAAVTKTDVTLCLKILSLTCCLTRRLLKTLLEKGNMLLVTYIFSFFYNAFNHIKINFIFRVVFVI